MYIYMYICIYICIYIYVYPYPIDSQKPQKEGSVIWPQLKILGHPLARFLLRTTAKMLHCESTLKNMYSSGRSVGSVPRG